MRIVICAMGAFLLSSCMRPPRSLNRDAVEINSFIGAIACEVASVARDPDLGRRYGLPDWHVKSRLDLTVISTVGADGKVVQTIATSAGVPTITPSLGATSKQTSIAHVEFATDVHQAIAEFDAHCEAGPDPSGTRMGLAAWFASTLQALSPRTIGALAYTIEFDIIANAGLRFGYIITLTRVDAGPAASIEGTHRLTVTIGPPDAVPPPAKPVEVIIVGDRRSPNSAELNAPAGKPSLTLRGRFRPKPSISGRLPALNDPDLNRLLIQQSPVRLALGSLALNR